MREVSFDPIMNWAKGVRKSNAILKESYGSLGARMEKLQGLIKNSTNAKDIEKYTKQLNQVQKAAAKHPGNLAAEKSKGVGGKGGGDKGGKGGGVWGAISKFVGLEKPMEMAKKAIEFGKKANVPVEVGNGVKNPMKSMDGFGLGKMGIENKQDNGASAAEKVEKFQGKINGAIEQVGLAFMPMLNRLMDFALRLADTLLPMIMQAIQPLLDMLNQVPIGDILEQVMNVAVAIIAAIGPILEQLTPLFANIFEMLGPLITDIGEFIVALVEGLAPILALVAHIISAVLGPALVFIGKILGVVIDIIKWVAKIALAILKPIIEFIALLIDGIMWLFGQSNEFSGKGADGKPKTLTPPDPEKDSKVTAIDAGAQLNKGLAATTPTVNAGKGKSDKAVHKAAGEVTSGGPRVININGVKFAEKIELSVISAKEGINHLEKQLQEMFLRILNSGAVVQ
ncbi:MULTISPECIES: hypothetical protein [Niastella]|uniref:Phage tail tape measure protein n=1 Tax=Niastella soli TaxID=2821487 RepID=A0ABS3YRN7_9BACT|nr:hypothetical protein [Niastella soli]MBO9200581.1 hypothetical protein [Niastella soli]